ncbi:hypothetical protein [Levilactobacillus brevis]|uniref:hypothetical protein n=1 Tax=Levilactobacillus brevis TaxID=1580 RepID=UPI0035A2D89C
MKEWIKGHKSILIIGVVIVIFVIPSLINIGIGVAGYFDFGVGSDGDWVNFWGSYLSSLMGVIGPIIFTIYYTQTQIKTQVKAGRQAQVQAYLKQERLIALNEYEKEMLDAVDKINDAGRNLLADNVLNPYDPVDAAIESLQNRCNKYALLTSDDDSKDVVEIQSEIQKYYSKNISGFVPIQETMSLDDIEDGLETNDFANRISHRNELDELAKFILNEVSRVKKIFESLYQDEVE